MPRPASRMSAPGSLLKGIDVKHNVKSIHFVEERLRKLPVSGMVITSTPETFLRSLPDLLPVRVDKAAEGGWRISPRG